MSSTKTLKAKGRRLQNWIVERLRSYLRLPDCDIESRPMGSYGEDIVMSHKARKLFPFAIECKNQEKVNIWSAWKQCKANTDPERLPLLIVTRNRQEPLAIVDADWFLLEMTKDKSQPKTRKLKNDRTGQKKINPRRRHGNDRP